MQNKKYLLIFVLLFGCVVTPNQPAQSNWEEGIVGTQSEKVHFAGGFPSDQSKWGKALFEISADSKFCFKHGATEKCTIKKYSGNICTSLGDDGTDFFSVGTTPTLKLIKTDTPGQPAGNFCNGVTTL